MNIEFLHPDGLPKNPAFSQVAVVRDAGRTIYVGGQNAVTQDGQIVGKDDIAAQTGQALANVEVALRGAGVELANLVKLTIYLVQGHDARQAFGGAQPFLRRLNAPPVISVLVVAGLANPDFLVEIEAIAVA